MKASADRCLLAVVACWGSAHSEYRFERFAIRAILNGLGCVRTWFRDGDGPAPEGAYVWDLIGWNRAAVIH